MTTVAVGGRVEGGHLPSLIRPGNPGYDVDHTEFTFGSTEGHGEIKREFMGSERWATPSHSLCPTPFLFLLLTIFLVNIVDIKTTQEHLWNYAVNQKDHKNMVYILHLSKH